MSDFEIVAVQDKHGLRQFIDLPYRLYRGDPYWVPQLRIAQKELFDQKKHPFYANAEMQCFLALRAGRPIGRIAAIKDRNYIQFSGEQAGAFGFFECLNEQPVASALFAASREWSLKRGAEVIRGPLNPSTNYECAALVEGFDSSPRIMMPYNPHYYDSLIQGAGLRKAKDLYAYHSATDKLTMDRIQRLAERSAEANDVRIRPIRMKAFEEDVELVWKVYNSAWERNWGFVPVTRDEFLFMAHDMKAILIPEFVLLGEVRGKVVGFALGLPDINQALRHTNGRLLPLGLFKILYHKRSIDCVRILVLGVTEEYRTAGVAAGFYLELFRQAVRLGYHYGEMSWILEDNTLMNRSAEALGCKRYKTYRIYEWN